MNNVLAVAYVPEELGRAWSQGKLTDIELWKHDATGTGDCLWVAEMVGACSWRNLSRLMQLIPPGSMAFRTRISSMEKRCKIFGATMTFADPSGAKRYFGTGTELHNFLSSMGVKLEKARS